ncbi:MAG TPA: cysteine dioxygenase family protein [Planosporangium sp.]|nr:cysteine dioxygenase family protein [Planosporangium sp.]
MTGLAAIARHYAADPSSWPLAPRFDAASRWYARIGGDASHEAWLLTWLPGQSTDLHDHGGSAGAFVVVSGVLTEQVVRVAEAGPAVRVAEAGPAVPRQVTLAGGAVRAFGPRHVHRIVNAGTGAAVSLHVYAPALREMTRYRIDDGVLSVAVVEKAGVDW